MVPILLLIAFFLLVGLIWMPREGPNLYWGRLETSSSRGSARIEVDRDKAIEQAQESGYEPMEPIGPSNQSSRFRKELRT